MAQWQYKKDGKIRGPVSGKQLKQLADNGGILPEDRVRKSGMEKWAKAKHVKGLFIIEKPPLQIASADDKQPPSISEAAGSLFNAARRNIEFQFDSIKSKVEQQEGRREVGDVVDATISVDAESVDSPIPIGAKTKYAMGFGCAILGVFFFLGFAALILMAIFLGGFTFTDPDVLASKDTLPPPIVQHLADGRTVDKLSFSDSNIHEYYVFDESGEFIELVDVMWKTNDKTASDLEFVLRDPKWTKQKIDSYFNFVTWQTSTPNWDFTKTDNGYRIFSPGILLPDNGIPMPEITVTKGVDLSSGKWNATIKTRWKNKHLAPGIARSNFQDSSETRSGSVERLSN